MATQIKLRRDTYQNWFDNNPVLGLAEPGYDTTNKKLKIGDGNTTWRLLPYFDDQISDLSAVAQNIVPDVDNTRDLGSPAKQWRHVYTAGGSIYLDNIKLTNNAGKLEITKVINPGEENEEPDSEDSNAGNSVTEKLTNGEHEFKLESNGTLTLDGDPFTGGGGGSGDRLVNGDHQVVLGSSGNITIPKNKEITLPASTDEDRYGGDISIMGQRGYGNWSTEGNAGFGSSIYIRSGDGGENNVSDQGGEGGEVWIRSGDGQAGNNGGTASLIAGSAKWNNSGSAIYGGNVRITAGNANEDASGFGRGGNVDINAGEGDQSDGSVNINTVGGDFTWTFDPDGVLTIPSSGDIKRSGVSVLGGGGSTGNFTFNANTIANDNDASIVVGGSSLGNIEVNAVDEFGPPDGPGGVWRLFIGVDAYPTLGTTVQIGDTVTTSWGTPITATIVDIQQDDDWQIHVDQDITAGHNDYDTVTFTPASIKTWTFGQDGDLTLPAGGDILNSNGDSVLGGGATSYAPDDTDNWNDPTINTISAALDELAARVTALQNYEIDGGNANTPALGELLIDGNGA